MEFDNVVRSRRSIRKYKSTPVPWKFVLDIIDAARFSPTVGGLQNFSVVAVVDPRVIAKLAEISKQDWVGNAKVILALCIDYDFSKEYDRESVDHEVGAIMENMLLKATDLGLGSCWVEAFDKAKAKEILKAKIDVVAFVTLGFPDEVVESKAIRSFSEVIHYNSYGNAVFDLHEKIKSPRVAESLSDFMDLAKFKFKRFVDFLKKGLK